MDRVQRRTAAVLLVAIIAVLAASVLVLMDRGADGEQTGPAEPDGGGQGEEPSSFTDDFSDASSGWDTLDEEDLGAAGYEAGAYRVTVTAQATALNVRAPVAASEQAGASVEVSVRDVTPGGDELIGLFCRNGDSGAQKYQLLYGYDGSYRIVRERDRTPTVLDEGSSGVAVDPATPHRLRIDCVGGATADQPVVLRLAVDGQVVAEVTDDEPLPADGRRFVGLAVESSADPAGTDVLFDDLAVQTGAGDAGLPELAMEAAAGPDLPAVALETDFSDASTDLPTEVQTDDEERTAKGSYLPDGVYQIASGENGTYDAVAPDDALEGEAAWLVAETRYIHEGLAVDFGVSCLRDDEGEGGYNAVISRQGLYAIEIRTPEGPSTVGAGNLEAELPTEGELRVECLPGGEMLPTVLRIAVDGVLLRRVEVPTDQALPAGTGFGLFARFNEPNEVRFDELTIAVREGLAEG
jgi:hypothetical protein